MPTGVVAIRHTLERVSAPSVFPRAPESRGSRRLPPGNSPQSPDDDDDDDGAALQQCAVLGDSTTVRRAWPRLYSVGQHFELLKSARI
jgi:hypothetical protein